MSETPGIYADGLTVIEKNIHTVRGQRVVLDSDLAAFFCVPTNYLNDIARRNPRRFPNNFRFRLTAPELADLPTAKTTPPGRRLPFGFTKLGVAMLASVLHTPQAVRLSIEIIRAVIANRDILPGLDLDVLRPLPPPNPPTPLRIAPCLTQKMN